MFSDTFYCHNLTVLLLSFYPNCIQVESLKRNSPAFSFPHDVIPDSFGGRAAFARLPVGYGTISTGVLNDSDYIKTRTHCYDDRAYGPCMTGRSAAWLAESQKAAPLRVVFGKNKRDINPMSWGRR